MNTQEKNQQQTGQERPGNQNWDSQNPGENQRNQDPTRRGDNWQEEE